MPRLDLVADCDACAALCCVWIAFDASLEFAFSKPAGVPCRYITADCRCAIHASLVRRGFPGCAAYDCHGAGQRATALFARSPSLTDREQHDAFALLREVHELLWLLDGAARLVTDAESSVAAPSSSVADPALASDLASALADLEVVATSSIESLLAVDLRPHRTAARALLRRVRAGA